MDLVPVHGSRSELLGGVALAVARCVVVSLFVLSFSHFGLCVADVAASEVSINKINSPRDVTHTLPGGFPFLLHISEAPVPPHCEWSCCLLQVADLLGAVAAALLMRLPSGGARPPGFALAAGVSDGLAVLLELAKRSRVGAVAQLVVGSTFGAKKLAGGPFIYAGMNQAWIFLDAMLVGLLHEFLVLPAADLRDCVLGAASGGGARLPCRGALHMCCRCGGGQMHHGMQLHVVAGAHPLLCCGPGMACLLWASQFSLSMCGFNHLYIWKW